MAFYRQPCESYFVEDHEESQRRIRQIQREQQKIVNRQKQQDIADELNRQASSEYGLDILRTMERLEVSRSVIKSEMIA